MKILEAKTADDLHAAYPVLSQLRPQYDEKAFVAAVTLQMQAGYRLVWEERDGQVAGAAGFVIGHKLAWGRHLYVDDLVVAPTLRSTGVGESLFLWLIAEARRCGCKTLHLDSGVQRFAAHRFYLRQRMDITSHHFVVDLLEH